MCTDQHLHGIDPLLLLQVTRVIHGKRIKTNLQLFSGCNKPVFGTGLTDSGILRILKLINLTYGAKDPINKQLPLIRERKLIYCSSGFPEYCMHHNPGHQYGYTCCDKGNNHFTFNRGKQLLIVDLL